MFYIVKVKVGEQWYRQEYQGLDQAVGFMGRTDYFCELYAWIAGEEKYMGNNREPQYN